MGGRRYWSDTVGLKVLLSGSTHTLVKDDQPWCEVCRELGLSWLNTRLSPPVTLSLLLQQVLAGNCSNPEILCRTGQTSTAAAYRTAKGRLPVEVVEQVSRRVAAAAAQRVPQARPSFADALYWMRHAKPGQSLPPLRINLERPGCREPRARKRRPKNHPHFTQPREVLRKCLILKD